MATYKRATAEEIYNYVTGQSSSMSSQYPTTQPKANNQKLMKLSDYEEQQRKKEEEEKKRLKAQSEARQKSREERSRAEKAAEQLNVQKKKEILDDAAKTVNPRTNAQKKVLEAAPKKKETKKASSAPALPQSRQPVKQASYQQQPSYKVADSALKLQQLEYDRAYEKAKAENPNAPEETVKRLAQNEYNAMQNERIAKSDAAYNREFAKEHPALGTIGSFGSNMLSGAGAVLEFGDAVVDGRQIDPNSPYFKYTRQTQDLRSGALENIEENADTKIGKTLGKGAYQLGTTLGDMALSRAITAPLGGAGYAANMALQAASSTAQDAASRGLSNEQIMTEAIVSGALTAACEKLGFDKVFKPSNTTTVKELAKNVVKGFAAEGAEEATEELGNTITDLLVGGEKSALLTSIYSYMEQGYSRPDAFDMAIKDAAKQIGSSFVLGGISGGIMAGANSAPNYISSATDRINSSLFPNQINDIQQTSVNAENLNKTQAKPIVESANENFDKQNQNAVTGQISADNGISDSAKNEVSYHIGDDGIMYIDDDTDFDTDPLKTLGNTQAQTIANNINNDKNVIKNPDATVAEKNSAQSNLIKSEYDAEAYEGITGDKTETYTSGNVAVDAMLNTNGRLNKTVTVDAQAEQKLIDFAANKFNRNVRFVDTLQGADGYYDKDTGEIVIARDSQKKHVFVFGHEFMHSIENSDEYFNLTTHLRNNSAFVSEKLAESGGKWETLLQNKITEYENALGKTLTPAEAEAEIFADAIADELFSDYNSMESLATQNRSVFLKLKQWFYEKLVAPQHEARGYSNKNKASRMTYALMLKAEKAAMNVQSGEGVTYNVKDTEYVDLSKDNELSKRLSGLNGSAKYKAIRDYILEALSDNDIHLSDGKIAIVDKSDALHIANKSADKKTAHISELNQLIDKAKLYAEDTNPSHNKFDYFCYYIANVRYGDKIYPVYLNVGKGINDQKYHLYDVTEKIKDTANRLNGFERPKPNEGYAQKISVFNDSISDFAENVNNNKSYSATSPEQSLIKSALNYFGKTYSWNETGYLTPGGSKLDFSGKNDGAPGGYRTVDHRDIWDAFPEDMQNSLEGTDAMIEFMRQGNIRISPESNGINLSVMPTKAQETALADYISRARGEVILDIDDTNGNTVASVEYPKGTHSSKVISDIKRYFSDGIEPTVSEVAKFRYSANKPEIIAKITSDYGYSEASANSIYKAARTMKQNAGSTADAEELTMAVVSAIENTRKGEFDSNDVERITRLIAQDAQTVNEDFVAEYKPILDYIKGKKLIISEEDISSLGNEFSYVKGKLFPYVTLTKGDGNIDSFYQDLAAEFPAEFNAEIVTSPADQLNTILSFIEDYRQNRTFNPYLAESEAYENLYSQVESMLKGTNLDNDTLTNKLAELCRQYGEHKNGIPQSTDGETRVRRAAASFYGTEAVQKNPDRKQRFAQNVLNGKWDYQVQRQGEEAKQFIDSIKAEGDIPARVEQEYRRLKEKIISKEYTPKDIVQASALSELLSEYLTETEFEEYVTQIAEVGTNAGQMISALRFISQFSGAQVLNSLDRYVEKENRQRMGKYADEIETSGVAQANGQFDSNNKPVAKSGIIELIATKKKEKLAKIVIPEKLREDLRKAKKREDIEAATKRINEYLLSQVHYSWWDKANAFRYFAMLSSPRTIVRNVAGNLAMSGVSRVKDTVAAGLSKLPIAKDYKEGSVQTSSAISSADGKRAAQAIMSGDDTVQKLLNAQDKYTGREGLALEKQKNALYHVKLVGGVLGKASDIQQKLLDDTPFKKIRAKSVIAQSITANINNGNIKNVDDFLAVALHENTEHLDNETKIKYARLYDAVCKQAAQEADEATFREENELANKVNKLRQGDKIWERALGIAVDGLVPFVKTPANIIKRGVEYSPAAVAKTLTYDRYQLAQGNIDRNAYINNLAKGLTGTGIFALGALLGWAGALTTGDDDEEDEAERTLEGGQEYAINIGDSSYTVDWLSPAALPLFMGAKTYDAVLKYFKGDKTASASYLMDIMQEIAEPMFAQTMLSGIDGAFRAISRDSMYEDNSGASFVALVNYCAENWAQQFIPSVLGAVARTADDTVRTYYTEKGEEKKLFGNLLVGAQKKVPGAANKTPAKLDMWGQPVSSGSLPERLIENFISPGYAQKKTSDEATKALHTFATDNGIKYTDIIPNTPEKYFTTASGQQINLTAKEYELYASAIGKARKEAVEKHLVRGEPVEVELTVKKIKSSNKSGLGSDKITYRGTIPRAKNTYNWAPSGKLEGYVQYDETGKAVSITPATDETFRKELFDEVMKSATDTAKSNAQAQILENRKNKKE